MLAKKPFVGFTSNRPGPRGEVILFVDTFCHHFDPETPEAAEKRRRLDGHNRLPKVVLGVKFTDGIEVVRSEAQAAEA
jgi:hypothetical protein